MRSPTGVPIVVRCADGYELHGASFAPSTRETREATIIVAPAMLVRQEFYARFAEYAADRGFQVLTYDNRGAGRSLAAQPSGWTPRLREWGELDLPAVIDHAERSAPSHRLFIVGHSMGGQIVALSKHVHRVDAIVTVGATAAWWGHWPLPFNLGILAWYSALPVITRVLPVIPAEALRVGPNVSSTVVRDWARWGRHPAYINGPFGLQPEARNYRGRVLALSFSDDVALGCRRAVEALHEDYVQADFEHRHLDPSDVGARRVGHFGYFRGPAAPRLWDDTIEWLGCARMGARVGPVVHGSWPPCGD